MSFFFNIKYKFSIINLIKLKKKFNHKVSFKKKYKFLGLKSSPSATLSTRFMKNGNYLKIYKILKYFYYKFILKKQLKSIPLNTNFIFFFNKYKSFRNLDKVLFWKFSQLDCIFSIKGNYSKKNKISSLNLKYINGIKKLLLCINFIKYIVLLSVQKKKKNLNYNMFKPLYNYIINDKNNLVIALKYKIYRYKLTQGSY